MNDTVAGQAVVEVMKFLAFIEPLALVPFAFMIGGAGMKKLFDAAKNGVSKVASKAGRAGKSAAMNSKYGQAAQQFMGNRKAIASLKGKEALRQTLNKHPELAKFMGGAGGGDIANRFLDKENRAKRAEEVTNAQRNVTGSIANAIGNGENIHKAMQDGKWAPDANGKRRDVSAEDRAGYRKLMDQGYIDPQTGRAKNDAVLATAAMQSIMRTELATDQNVRGISGLLKGAGSEANAQFTEDLRTEAAAKNYKNFSGASVTDGVVTKFMAKTGELETGDAVADRATRIKGAKAVIASSIRGINKDALDGGMDRDFLDAIEETYNKDFASKANGNKQIEAQLKRDYVVKLAEQTSHIDKEATIKQIVDQFHGAVSKDDFMTIQRSIKSGGAVPMPAQFATASTASGGTPTVTVNPSGGGQAAQQPTQTITTAGTLNVPHGQPVNNPAPMPNVNFTVTPSGLAVPQGYNQPTPPTPAPPQPSTPPPQPRGNPGFTPPNLSLNQPIPPLGGTPPPGPGGSRGPTPPNP